jgi:DNA repair photolyase
MPVIYEPSGRAREYAGLAANLYSGCSHGCKYCYAPPATRRDREEFHANPQPRKNVLEQLKKDCKKLDSTCPAVLFSFTTDPYQQIDDTYRLTRQGIEILHEKGISVEILTKGGTRAVKDFDLLNEKDAFATTLTFLNNRDSEEWEPNAAPPADRIRTMKKAFDRGIKVWASLEPVIDPEQSLEIIRQTYGFVELFKVGKLNHHPIANAIDWYKFGWESKKLLESLGCRYYLKHDLRSKMKLIS